MSASTKAKIATPTKIVVIGKVPTALAARLSAVGTVSYLERTMALSEAEIIGAASQAKIILTEPPDQITASIIKACPELIMIAQRAVGYDNINLNDCEPRPILVTNTPGVLDNATADLAFTLVLAAGRRIVEADNYVRSGQWQGFENDLLLGTEMYGRTIGIIGMGRIGSAMARRAQGFGMNILYCRANETNSTADDSNITLDQNDLNWQAQLGAKRVSLNTVLRQSDYISLHCPHNKQTEKLIGKEQFSLMKKSAIFINTARGKIVDEEALSQAIESGQIKGAGLDVFYHEPKVSEALLKAPNVVLAPHIGSASEQTRYAMAELAVKSVELALAGKLPANALNAELFDHWLKNRN
ncbi:D-glycerate dehydrogenase [bacterium]|nr:D-glycerate dehydrogenase [bacterium]MBP9807620.1 D-glycerate dehydrogenase [bacterium]